MKIVAYILKIVSAIAIGYGIVILFFALYAALGDYSTWNLLPLGIVSLIGGYAVNFYSNQLLKK